MNETTQPTTAPSHFALSFFNKLTMFCLSCLTGWTTSVIVHQTVSWLRAPTGYNNAVVGATIQHVIQQILNALYR
jgi:hypothetical protein